MPYRHLLAARLRGRNERLDEPSGSRRERRTDARPPLRLHVLRHNPQDPASVRASRRSSSPSRRHDLFVALNEVRATLDPSLQFDFVCRAGICGSCGMLVDGRPRLACRTLTRDLGPDINARAAAGVRADRRPLGEHRQMDARHGRAARDLGARGRSVDCDRIEQRMEPDRAEEIYELDRCIECGCCVAGCGTARMRPDFVGAVGITRSPASGSTRRDSEPTRTTTCSFGTDDGVFGWHDPAGCEDVAQKAAARRSSRSSAAGCRHRVGARLHQLGRSAPRRCLCITRRPLKQFRPSHPAGPVMPLVKAFAGWRPVTAAPRTWSPRPTTW